MEHDQDPAHTTAAHEVPERYGTRGPIPVRPKSVPPPAPSVPPLVLNTKISCTSDRVRDSVRVALARASNGEQWYYDVSLVMVPSARATMASMYAIVIYTPSARLDLKSFGAVELVDDFPSEEAITNAVRKLVAKLRDVQSEALRQPVDLRELRRQPRRS